MVIYGEYGVKRLNRGIGFPTAAIELPPTYGKRLGLKGKVATHWARNPHYLTAAYSRCVRLSLTFSILPKAPDPITIPLRVRSQPTCW
jgi:hypothetical protein